VIERLWYFIDGMDRGRLWMCKIDRWLAISADCFYMGSNREPTIKFSALMLL